MELTTKLAYRIRNSTDEEKYLGEIFENGEENWLVVV